MLKELISKGDRPNEKRTGIAQPLFFYLIFNSIIALKNEISDIIVQYRVSKSGQVACKEMNGLREKTLFFIKKEMRQAFLTKKRSKIVWSCLGDKSACNSHFHYPNDPIPVEVAGVYILRRLQLRGKQVTIPKSIHGQIPCGFIQETNLLPLWSSKQLKCIGGDDFDRIVLLIIKIANEEYA